MRRTWTDRYPTLPVPDWPDLGISNPYWDEIAPQVEREEGILGNGLVVGDILKRDEHGELRPIDYAAIPDRHAYVGRYSWSIPDPISLAFVREHAGPVGLVDPMAGTGYWGFLLEQLGVPVACYDTAPASAFNAWHGDNPLWLPVTEGWATESVDAHPDRTLLLSWPPYGDRIGYDTLAAYRGERVVYVGEHHGCCGDERLFDHLDDTWRAVAAHTPVQWFGMHDTITVYERAG